MSSSFPSSEERMVASSLLLLQTNPPSPSFSTPRFRSNLKIKSFIESPMLSGSNSSSSSLTNDDAVSSEEEEEIKSRTVSFFSATARYRQMKFKIVRKIRSKVMWTSLYSGDRNRIAGAAAKVSPGCISGEASSCLSSNSSGISSARSLRYFNRGRGVRVEGMEVHHAKRTVGSPHLRRRGEAILKLLSLGGSSSEVKIRQMLGDSPDTSKALRMLLRVDAVKRSGSGGRHDPYVYTLGNNGEEPYLSWVRSLVKESPTKIKEKLATTVSSIAVAGSNMRSQMEYIDHAVLGARLEQVRLDRVAPKY